MDLHTVCTYLGRLDDLFANVGLPILMLLDVFAADMETLGCVLLADVVNTSCTSLSSSKLDLNVTFFAKI